jgi:hypothetical protein
MQPSKPQLVTGSRFVNDLLEGVVSEEPISKASWPMNHRTSAVSDEVQDHVGHLIERVETTSSTRPIAKARSTERVRCTCCEYGVAAGPDGVTIVALSLDGVACLLCVTIHVSRTSR